MSTCLIHSSFDFYIIKLYNTHHNIYMTLYCHIRKTPKFLSLFKWNVTKNIYYQRQYKRILCRYCIIIIYKDKYFIRLRAVWNNALWWDIFNPIWYFSVTKTRKTVNLMINDMKKTFYVLFPIIKQSMLCTFIPK